MKLLSCSYARPFPGTLPQLRRITPISGAWRTKPVCRGTASIEVEEARDGSRSGVFFCAGRQPLAHAPGSPPHAALARGAVPVGVRFYGRPIFSLAAR